MHIYVHKYIQMKMSVTVRMSRHALLALRVSTPMAVMPVWPALVSKDIYTKTRTTFSETQTAPNLHSNHMSILSKPILVAQHHVCM